MRDRVTKKESNINKIPGFLSDLETRVVSENKFKLLKPLKYNSALSLLPIVVPKDFITNFASFILVKFGEKSSTLHDYMYDAKLFDRAKCDKIFLEALKSEGVGFARRWACYLGVRVAGWSHY